MQVANFLEAFSFMYGWSVYGLFFLLFTTTGLVWYPLAKVIIETLIDFASSNKYSGDAHVKSAIIKSAIIIIVFAIAMVPMVPVNTQQATVRLPCDSTVAENLPIPYFQKSSIYVPIIPYLASSVGQGFNNAIYNNTPCVSSLRSIMTVFNSQTKLFDTTEDQSLASDIKRFNKECYTKAAKLYNDINLAKFGVPAKLRLNKLTGDFPLANQEFSGPTDSSLNGIADPYIISLFYKGELIDKLDPSEEDTLKLKLKLPVKSDYSVDDVAVVSDEKSDSQEGSNEGPVSCGDWYETKLKPNLIESGKIAFGLKQLANPKTKAIGSCQSIANASTEDLLNPIFVQTNKNTITNCASDILSNQSDIDTSDQEKLDRTYLNMALSSPQTDNILTTSQKAAIGGVGAMAVLNSITSFFGFDLGIDAGDIAGFYTGLYMVKIFMKFLQPLLLMALFMFWGFYLIAGGLNGKTLIKGTLFIFLITLFPGLWSIADSLDDYMFSAMYSKESSEATSNLVYQVNKSPNSVSNISMVLFDMSMTIFYVILPGILLWFVSQADMGSATQLNSTFNSGAGNLSGGTGANKMTPTKIATGTLGKGKQAISKRLSKKEE